GCNGPGRAGPRNRGGGRRQATPREPHSPRDIAGLHDLGVQPADHADRLAVERDERGLPRVEEADLTHRLPRDALLAQPERGEEVGHDPLEMQEVDRRSAPPGPARRPHAVAEYGEGLRLARPPVRIAAVALAELEGPDELRAAVEVQAEGAQQAGEG